ncbi:DUF4199 family protein [Hymenobacter psoromatis]|uniref:DUF4199 family protein n=1 Tax=Hymenobacter psoromatis TaxID=1484116 RepID=UPI001CC19F36|nr:DUF4199 family protein [Hymenobacter psoromatis]
MQAANPNTKPEISRATAGELIVRLGLRFGVGVGVAGAAWLLFLQLTENNAFGPKQLMGQLLVPIAVAGSQWTLRRLLAPVPPGVGRAMAVGWLTATLAAALAGASVWGLAHGVGEAALIKNRAEMVEIVRVQQQIRPKEKRNAQFEAQELQQMAQLTIRDLAVGTFTRVLLLGLVLAIPSGLFLRK